MCIIDEDGVFPVCLSVSLSVSGVCIIDEDRILSVHPLL